MAQQQQNPGWLSPEGMAAAAEEAKRKAALDFIKSKHKMELSAFEIQNPQADLAMRPGHALGVGVGSLLLNLLDPQHQAGAQFGNAAIQAFQGQRMQQFEGQKAKTDQQRNLMMLMGNQQGELAQIAEGEANRYGALRGTLRDRSEARAKQAFEEKKLKAQIVGKAMAGKVTSADLEEELGYLSSLGITLPETTQKAMRDAAAKADQLATQEKETSTAKGLADDLRQEVIALNTLKGNFAELEYPQELLADWKDLYDRVQTARKQFPSHNFPSIQPPPAGKAVGPSTRQSVSAARADAARQFDDYIKGVQASGGVPPTDPGFKKAVQDLARTQAALEIASRLEKSPDMEALKVTQEEHDKAQAKVKSLRAELEQLRRNKPGSDALPSEEKEWRKSVSDKEVELAGVEALRLEYQIRRNAAGVKVKQPKNAIPNVNPLAGSLLAPPGWHYENGVLVKNK